MTSKVVYPGHGNKLDADTVDGFHVEDIFKKARTWSGGGVDYNDILGNGTPAQGAKFVVFWDNATSTCKARNGLTGRIDYQNADASIVLSSVFTALKSLGGGKVKFDCRQTYGLPCYSQLTLSGVTGTGPYIFEGPVELQRVFSGDTTFMLEMKDTTTSLAIMWKDVQFTGLYGTKNYPLINIESTGGPQYIFQNCFLRYGLPALRLAGVAWSGIYHFSRIYLSQGYSHPYTGTQAIILLDGDGGGTYGDIPKINHFYLPKIHMYSDATNPIDYFIYVNGGYNVFHPLQIDAGYVDEACIYIKGWSNKIYAYRGQDILTTANTDANVHLDSTDCFGNYVEGTVSDVIKTVKISNGAYRNYIKMCSFGNKADVDATGAGIENVIEFVPPHLASATAFTVSHVGAAVKYLVYVSPATQTIEHHTSGDTLLKEESGSVHTNLGASGSVALALPQDALAGTSFKFVVMAAYELQVDPGAAGAVYINGAKQSDDKYVYADDEAESVELVADGNGDWIAIAKVGDWAVQT